MLEFYAFIARWLYPARLVIWFAAVAAIGAFAGTVLFSSGPYDEAYMLMALTILLWCLCLCAITYAFVHPVPSAEAADPFLLRVRVSLKRGARWFMAFLMSAMCVLVVIASLRAVGLITRNLG